MPKNLDENLELILNQDEFPRLPPEASATPDLFVRATVASLAAGSGSYMLLPEIFSISREGLIDEVSALTTAASFACFASIKSLRKLCENEEEAKPERAVNAMLGASGGTGLGATLAGLTKGATILLDGGIMFVCILGGVAIAEIKSNIKRSKSCSHCRKKANCSNRICPYCDRIFYPSQHLIDCSQTIVLSWYQIASHLDAQGLKYHESVNLVQNESHMWDMRVAGNETVVLCSSYMDWVTHNIDTVLSYRQKK